MKTVKMLREERDKLVAEAEAITILATEDARELSQEETNRIDAILGTADKPGLIAAKDQEIDRAVRLDGAMRDCVARRATEQNRFVDDEAEKPQSKLILPASAKRKVAHYDQPEDAYKAGMFALATIFGSNKAKEFCGQHGLEIKAAHSTFDNEKGGYMVPEVMESAIIRLVEERGVFRRNSFVYPMGADSVTIPRRSGGFTVYYPGEGKTLTASDLTLNQIKLAAKKAAILTAITSELDENAVATLASLITEEIAYAFAAAEDNEGFNGDGTSTYGGTVGLANALQAGAIQDAASGNTTVALLDLQDFRSAIGKMLVLPGMTPVWYMHSTVYHNGAARLMDAAGGNTQADIAGGTMPMLLGYPVQFVQAMPSDSEISSGEICAYIGDLRMASTFGTRRGVTIGTDSSVYFTSDQLAIRATQRYDINVHERGSASASGPIVALKTA